MFIQREEQEERRQMEAKEEQKEEQWGGAGGQEEQQLVLSAHVGDTSGCPAGIWRREWKECGGHVVL